MSTANHGAADGKPVYLDGQPIGRARTWRQVYAVVQQRMPPRRAVAEAVEGPDGFYIATRPTSP